jgi:protein phosphatase
MTQMRWGQASDTGQVRSINQDSMHADAPLFAVADGMGGHRGGEVASAVALETLIASVSAPTTAALVEGVQIANAAVFQRAQDDPELRGMGTTLCAVALVADEAGERLGIVNVGDSRVYLLRDGALSQLTEDHSLVESLVRQGRITEDEALVHPQRNILTRALGIGSSVDVDAWELPAVTGDRYLLCSDGLFNEVELPVIESTMRKLADPSEAAHELVRLANEGGGRDNITAVVVDVVEGAGAAMGATRLSEAAEPDLGSLGAPPNTAPQPVVEVPLPPAPGLAAAGAADVATDVGGGLSAEVPPVPAGGEGRRRRRITWRVLVFLVALVALIGLVGYLVSSYASGSYFVTFDGDEVVIEQGRPGGFLLWDPTVEERTGIERDELQAVAVERVEEESSLDSLDDAQRFVENLERTGETGDDEPSGSGNRSTTTTTDAGADDSKAP